MSSYATKMMSIKESNGLSTSSNKTSARYAEAHRPSVTSQNTRALLEAVGTWACADVAPWPASLVQDSSLVINKDPLCLVLVVRAGIRDLCRSEVELRRTQLDDVSQPEIVTGLGEIERGTGLLEQLLCQGHAIICRGGVQPGDTHIPNDSVL